jgi:hypothetical protein
MLYVITRTRMNTLQIQKYNTVLNTNRIDI